MKGCRLHSGYPALGILFTAVAVSLIIRWVSFHHSSDTVAAGGASFDAEHLRNANKDMAAKEAHSIVLRSPGALLSQSSGGKIMQTVVANCAKGYVWRGSMCELNAASHTSLRAASNSVGQGSIRPPERE